MKIDIVTLFPDLFTPFLKESIIKRAIEKQAVTIEIHDLRTYSQEKNQRVDDYPFGGGAGAGVSINPVAFLVITEDNVRLMPVNHSSCVDRLLDYVPDLMEKVNCMMNKHMKCKKEQTEEIINQIKENSSKENVVKKDVKKPESKVETTYEFEYDQMEDE